MNRFSIRLALIASAASLAVACSREAETPGEATEVGATRDQTDPAPTAIGLVGGDGAQLGKLSVTEDPNGVTIKIEAAGLSEGSHGVHLHEKGTCEGPKFDSAGAHLNPAGKQHGRDNPQGSHLGDLANFAIPASGSGSTTLMVAGVTIRGPNALADPDGTSLVVHAKPDDYRTDPSGASGDRIACAVIAAPQ